MTLRPTVLLATSLSLVAPVPLAAQRVFEDYQPVEGFLRIGPEPDRAIPMVDKGYTLVRPDGDVRGVIVQVDAWPTHWGPADPAAGSLDAAALASGVAMLHITTGNRLDFLFSDTAVAELVRRIDDVLAHHALTNLPVFLAGLSLGGTRALRVAVFLALHGEDHALRLSAVAVADAPLDMIRLWHAEQRAIELGFHAAAADEGRWVSYLLETNLGGPPDGARDRWVAYAPYTYGAPLGGNARHLAGLPVRAYHEPDVDWWIEQRRKSYYEMNSLDLAGLVTELKVQGNDTAELVTSHQERDGFEEGSSPHTWSIVDNADLVAWFLGHGAGD